MGGTLDELSVDSWQRQTQTDRFSRLCVTSEWRESEEVEEEEGSRMVFFGQLREPELDCWSAPPLALRDEGHGQHIQQKIMRMKMRMMIYRWEQTRFIVLTGVVDSRYFILMLSKVKRQKCTLNTNSVRLIVLVWCLDTQAHTSPNKYPGNTDHAQSVYGKKGRINSLVLLLTLIWRLKGVICKNCPPVEFILRTNKGQHITRVTRNRCQLQLPLAF